MFKFRIDVCYEVGNTVTYYQIAKNINQAMSKLDNRLFKFGKDNYRLMIPFPQKEKIPSITDSILNNIKCSIVSV